MAKEKSSSTSAAPKPATAKAHGKRKKEAVAGGSSHSSGGSFVTTALAVLLGAFIVGVSFQDPERVRLVTSRALELVAPHLGLSVVGLGGGVSSENNSSSVGSMSDAFARSVDCKQALQYLTEAGPVKGFHVVCIQSTPLDSYVYCMMCL